MQEEGEKKRKDCVEGGIKGVVHDQIHNLAVEMSVVVKCWSAPTLRKAGSQKMQARKGKRDGRLRRMLASGNKVG